MVDKLSGLKLAVVGGDERQVILVEKLLELNADVNVWGLPAREELIGAVFCNDWEETIKGVHALILPMPGTDLQGNIISPLFTQTIQLTENMIQNIPSNTPIFIGVAKPFLKEWARIYKKKLIEIADLDQIAIPNSIPTAEGCIQMAMEKLPITIHGSKSIVLGFGRCGKTLARMLQAIGAKTIVFARKEADLCRIKEMGIMGDTYENLSVHLTDADLVINTIPTPILTKNVLKSVKNKNLLIIDIASAPGGTDFAVAEELGIEAILAPSLPGLVAAKTAGLILAEKLPKLILNEISLPIKSKVGGNIS